MVSTKRDKTLQFGQHSETARVLLLGRHGVGVGLASDVVARAASAAGWSVARHEVYLGQRIGSSSGIALHLASAAFDGPMDGFDFLLAFDLGAAAIGLPRLKPGGQLILPAASNGDLASWIRGSVESGVRPGGVASLTRHGEGQVKASPVLQVSWILGHLAGQLPWPLANWREALELGLRPRDQKRAQTAFAAATRWKPRWLTIRP